MTTLIRAGYVTQAYANWSRWVARCGLCPGAEQLQPCTPHFKCVECGTVTEVIWPTEDMVVGVERLLMMRPDPSTRNWHPGETLHDLMWENGEHGLLSNPPDDVKPGDLLMVLEGERIRVDNAPAIKHRVRKAIGV